MPTEPIITCPTCRAEIKLTESLAAPLIAATKQQYEKLLAQQNADVVKREQALKSREESLAQEKQSVDAVVADKLKAERQKLAADAAKRDQELKAREEQLAREKESVDAAVAEKLKVERARIAAEEAKKAKLALGNDLEQKVKELAELQDVLKRRDEKLAEAQKAQAELIKKERELADAKREMELTIETRVQASLNQTREAALKEAEDKLGLRVIEKDQMIAQLGRRIEELQKKMEQGSQQAQGEAMELQLESILTTKFPQDRIEPVPKGEHGGDILHRVMGPSGQICGTILWESKRARNWSDGWLAKLREDQRAAKAEICVIVSATTPKGIDTFDHIDGVCVTSQRCLRPVAYMLRQSLIELAGVRQAGEGQQTKMEMVYQYLTGPRFRQRVQGIVEAFSDMRDDLEKERKAIMKQWAKRDEQIDRVMQSTVGMYGDLQGIAGKTLKEIEGLRLPGLPGASGEQIGA